MSDTALEMYDLTVAAHQLISDLADIRERGHLKWHPDLVGYRLERLEEALAAIRTAMDAERSSGEWGGPMPDGEPELDFNGPAMDFVEHSCNCEWCLCCEPAGVGDEPLVWTIPAAGEPR